MRLNYLLHSLGVCNVTLPEKKLAGPDNLVNQGLRVLKESDNSATVIVDADQMREPLISGWRAEVESSPNLVNAFYIKQIIVHLLYCNF